MSQCRITLAADAAAERLSRNRHFLEVVFEVWVIGIQCFMFIESS